jgi:hypothetical protein
MGIYWSPGIALFTKKMCPLIARIYKATSKLIVWSLEKRLFYWHVRVSIKLSTPICSRELHMEHSRKYEMG